jgi:hypothetical protein
MGERVAKKVRQGVCEVDYEESALVINYELEICEVDERDRVVEVLERRPEVRRVKIKSLSADKNLAQLAGNIVEKCPYIHPSRVEEIEQLLIKLRKHTVNSNAMGADNNAAEAAASERRSKERASEERSVVAGSSSRRGGGGGADAQALAEDMEKVRRKMREAREQEEELPMAYIDAVEQYLELLYQVSGQSEKQNNEALQLQTRGAGMILNLCRDVMNLEKVIQDSTIMGALARVLQEEFKKSVDLTFNILRIFLSFSNFMEMHGLLANHRVGMLTMKVVEYEVRRWDHREEERLRKEEEYEEILQRAREEGEETSALSRVRRLREADKLKTKILQLKSEKMLFVAFYILINLAEDVVVERKMLNKGLLLQLESMLERSNGDLLIITVSFLRKLSIYHENKEMILNDTKIVQKLLRFLPCSSQPLVQMTLQLLFNLSFDPALRAQMVLCHVTPRLIDLLKVGAYRAKTLKVLYHLSADEEARHIIVESGGVPMIMGLIINFPNPILAKELAALAINLTHCSKACEAMVSNKGLNHLMDRFDNDYHERDQGLLKILRNLSYWTFRLQELARDTADSDDPVEYRYRGLWSPHFKLLLQHLTDVDDHDALIELVGTLANMTSDDVPANTTWSRLVKEFNLVSLFSKLLIPGMAQNDLLLEIIMLISAIARDGPCCDLIASSNLIGLLYQTWKERGEDTEIKLQLIHCFHLLLLRETSREEAMYSTRIVVDMIECLSHPNASVRSAADDVTDLVQELDRKKDGELGQLGVQIRKKRFEGYNQQWLVAHDLVNGGAGHFDYAGVGEYEDELNDDDLDDFNDRLGSMNMMKNKERLALDMSDLDAMGGGVFSARNGARMSDDMPSSGDGEDWDESGVGWN